MPLWFSSGKLILFGHAPKTGGSALIDYLNRRLGEPMLAYERSEAVKRGGTGFITNPAHFTKYDFANCIRMDQVDYSFAFVRDPMKRLMSEFRYQSGISRSSRLSFSSWAHLMLESARREPRIYQNHLRPQVDFVPDGAEVFRLEDGFDPLIRKLDQVFGALGPEEGVPRLNVSRSAPITVSRQDAELIESFYDADYERFGYPRPSRSEFRSDPIALSRRAQARAIAPALIAWQRRKWVRQPKQI